MFKHATVELNCKEFSQKRLWEVLSMNLSPGCVFLVVICWNKPITFIVAVTFMGYFYVYESKILTLKKKWKISNFNCQMLLFLYFTSFRLVITNLHECMNFPSQMNVVIDVLERSSFCLPTLWLKVVMHTCLALLVMCVCFWRIPSRKEWIKALR